MSIAGTVEDDAPGPRVAVWGTFDVDNFGDHLFPEIARAELGRRLPGAVVDVFSPYGWLHPTRLDNGTPVEPLGPWTADQAERMASAYDCIVIGGGELIHLNDPLLAPVYSRPPAELALMQPSRWFVEAFGPEIELTTPIVWHGLGVSIEPTEQEAARLRAALASRRYVSVRDPHSAARLARAGVERAIELVPDSGLLVDRLIPQSLIDDRLRRLRNVCAYPPGRALVMQGCDLIVPHARRLVEAVAPCLARHPDLELVVLETGRCRGDSEFADAVQASAPSRVFRLPAPSPLVDVAAALAGAAVYVGSSLHGAITAMAFQRPFLLLDLVDEPKLSGFAAMTGTADVVKDLSALDQRLRDRLDGHGLPASTGDLEAGVDRHFDRIAAIAQQAAAAHVRGRHPAPVPDRRALGAAAVRSYVRLLSPPPADA